MTSFNRGPFFLGIRDYLHGPFSAALGPRARVLLYGRVGANKARARARTQGVTARSRHPDRVDNIAVPDAGIPTMVPGNAFQQLVNVNKQLHEVFRFLWPRATYIDGNNTHSEDP